MAFVPLFCDSFDHYTNLASKWTSPGTDGTIVNGGARTGTSCLYMASVNGPQKAIGVQTNWIAGHAYKPPFLGGRIIIFYNTFEGDENVDAQINGDGSVSLTGGNPHTVLGTTAPGLVTTGIYSYLEYAVSFTLTQSILWLRINGQAVAPFNPLVLGPTAPGYAQIDLVELTGPGGAGGGTHDDFYIGYSTTPATIQNDFQGAVRIYPLIAVANKTPLQWTPLAGANWQETSQIPPPGDAAYVSDGTVGDQDQYQLDFIAGHGATGSYSIQFGQTVMSAKIDSAGSRSIAPDIGGNAGSSVALTTNYTMYEQTYSINPVTGLPFAPSDFTTTFLGPKVTA